MTGTAVAIGRLIEEHERPKAVARRKSTQFGERNAGAGNLPEPRGETRDVVGRVLGMSGPTYARAKAIVAAAEDDPLHFGDLPTQMGTTGNVHGAFQELKRRRAGEPDPGMNGAQYELREGGCYCRRR